MKTLIINCYTKKSEEKVKNYIELFKAHSDISVIPDFDVNLENTDYDAVVITGSQKNVSDGKVNEKLLEYVKESNRPILGICYGHHVFSKAYGCEVIREKRIKGKVEVEILNEDELFKGFGEKALFDENHADRVVFDEKIFDKELELLAESDLCEVEAMKSRKKPHYGVQFHPERSGKNGKKLIENFFKYVVKK